MAEEKEREEIHSQYMWLRHTTFVMERPSCWSRAAWGARAGTEVDGASSRPAPHTALAAIAGAPRGWYSHSRWTDVTAGTAGAGMEEERIDIYIQITPWIMILSSMDRQVGDRKLKWPGYDRWRWKEGMTSSDFMKRKSKTLSHCHWRIQKTSKRDSEYHLLDWSCLY